MTINDSGYEVIAYISTNYAEFFTPNEEEPTTAAYDSVECLATGVRRWAEEHNAPINWMRDIGPVLYPGHGAVYWHEGAEPTAATGWR